MPRTTCCVPGCCKRGGYPFPVNPDQRIAWLAAIQRSNWVPKDSSTVCKDHFSKSDFITEDGAPTEKLRKSAVPRLFWWTNSQPTLEKNNGFNKLPASSANKCQFQKRKNLAAVGSATNVSTHKLDTRTVHDEDDDEYLDDDEDDDFEDAGAVPDDSDEEYKGDDADDDDDDEEEIEDDEPVYVKTNGGRGRRRGGGQQQGLKAKKRKLVDSDDDLLSESKRSPVESMPEYSRQLNKAYKEISRLSTRCQLLDASLKSRANVTHRSRIIYQVGKYVLPHQLSFIESQILNSTVPAGQRRWSRRMRNISLGLHRHSRHAYSFMAKIFALPTEAELHKWGAQSDGAAAVEPDEPCNGVSLVEAEALVDEATFDNLMAVIL